MIIEFVNGSLTESVVGRMCWCVCGVDRQLPVEQLQDVRVPPERDREADTERDERHDQALTQLREVLDEADLLAVL